MGRTRSLELKTEDALWLDGDREQGPSIILKSPVFEQHREKIKLAGPSSGQIDF